MKEEEVTVPPGATLRITRVERDSTLSMEKLRRLWTDETATIPFVRRFLSEDVENLLTKKFKYIVYADRVDESSEAGFIKLGSLFGFGKPKPKAPRLPTDKPRAALYARKSTIDSQVQEFSARLEAKFPTTGYAQVLFSGGDRAELGRRFRDIRYAITHARTQLEPQLKALEAQAQAYYLRAKELGYSVPELRTDLQLIAAGDSSDMKHVSGFTVKSIAPIANKLRESPRIQIVSGEEFDRASGEVLLRGISDPSFWPENLGPEFMGYGTSGPGLYFSWRDTVPVAFHFGPQIARFKLIHGARILRRWADDLIPLELETANILSRARNQVFGNPPAMRSSTLTGRGPRVLESEEWNVLALREGYDAIYGVEDDLIVLDKSFLIADSRTLPEGEYQKFLDAIRPDLSTEEVNEALKELVLDSTPGWSKFSSKDMASELREMVQAFTSSGPTGVVAHLKSQSAALSTRRRIVEAVNWTAPEPKALAIRPPRLEEAKMPPGEKSIKLDPLPETDLEVFARLIDAGVGQPQVGHMVRDDIEAIRTKKRRVGDGTLRSKGRQSRDLETNSSRS